MAKLAVHKDGTCSVAEMRNIIEMYHYLKKHLSSHTVEISDNTIIAKRLIKTRSFASFKLTYLKNINEISYRGMTNNSCTLRFKNDEDLICQLGSVARLN